MIYLWFFFFLNVFCSFLLCMYVTGSRVSVKIQQWYLIAFSAPFSHEKSLVPSTKATRAIFAWSCRCSVRRAALSLSPHTSLAVLCPGRNLRCPGPIVTHCSHRGRTDPLWWCGGVMVGRKSFCFPVLQLRGEFWWPKKISVVTRRKHRERQWLREMIIFDNCVGVVLLTFGVGVCCHSVAVSWQNACFYFWRQIFVCDKSKAWFVTLLVWGKKVNVKLWLVF